MTTKKTSNKAVLWLQDSIALDATVIGNDEQTTIHGLMKATIAPTVDVRAPANDRAHVMLNRVGNSQRLVLGETLGEGGMGIVRSARQSDLGRNVAVKMLRKELSSEEATVAMLREAWVTGTLEHPNIVPVYYVDADEEGTPRIILKRIEGVSWASLIANADEVKRRFGATDLLAWNLGVMKKVIDAIRYAHSRNVLHRDLKPDNVMVGEFGEVYVVDWGIALSLQDDGETLLPLAKNVHQMAGTPAFMAPEMLGEVLDERTDVYLLGAILYQIITEKPPHLGATLEDIIASISESSFHFPANAPSELCSVSRKAMAKRPDDRFKSADAMGRAIQTFLKNRGSLQLSARAQRIFHTISTMVSQGAKPEALHDHWTECRFGFQSALETWPANPEAQQGLFNATEMIARVELEQGDPRVAARILRELESPSEDLATSVEKAVQALDDADAQLARLGQQLDKRTGQRTRVYILSILGVVWMGMELWGQLSGNIDRLATHNAMVVGSLLSLTVLIALVFRARTTLMKTVINRQFASALFVLLGSQVVISAVAGRVGLSPQQVQVLWILLWTVIAAMVAFTVERRTWPLPIGVGLCFVMASLWIEYRIYAMMGATAVMVSVGSALWWPKSKT